MGLFDFVGAWGDTWDEREKLREGMNQPIKDFDKEADKFLDNAERLDSLETQRGFAAAMGDRMRGNAAKNLGFGENGSWSLKNFQSERGDTPVVPDAAKAIPIPKLSPVSATSPGMAPIAAMPQQQQPMMPQMGPSPAMQQILAAQQQQNMYGQAQPYQTGGLLPMMATPNPNRALNVQGDGSFKDKLMKMMMGG
jgi:hypothetical protein